MSYQLFTDRTRKVMQLANQQAQFLNHEYVGVEHLFLGMVKEGSGVAAKVLGMFGINTQNALHEISKLIQPGPDIVTMGKLPLTPRAKLIISHANEESSKLNHNYVGTEHLLLGLLRERDGAAYNAMIGMGLNLDKIRDKVLEVIGETDNDGLNEHIASVESPLDYTVTFMSNLVIKNCYMISESGDIPKENHRTVHRIQRLESDLSESITMLNDLFRQVGEILDSETAKRLTDILDKHGVPKK